MWCSSATFPVQAHKTEKTTLFPSEKKQMGDDRPSSRYSWTQIPPEIKSRGAMQLLCI